MKVALLDEFRHSRPSKQRLVRIQITPSRDSAFTEGTMDTISLTSRVNSVRFSTSPDSRLSFLHAPNLNHNGTVRRESALSPITDAVRDFEAHSC
jgi:hypothetical protein